MDKDFIVEAVFNFLENGEDLPAEASKNPANRFAMQMAIMKQTYHKSGKAVSTADEAHTLAKANEVGLDAVIDKVNVRLGVVGGLTIIANGLMYWVTRLLP